MTIKKNSVYVNYATELLAFTLDTEAGTIEITKRVTNAFPQLTPFENKYYGANENEVVVDWILKDNDN